MSLQGLPELIGAGGCDEQVLFQGPAELPELEGKGNRKERPGHHDPFWMVHALLRLLWVLMLERWAFLGDPGGKGITLSATDAESFDFSPRQTRKILHRPSKVLVSQRS